MIDKKLRDKSIQFFPFLFFLLLTYLISYKVIGGVISIGDFPYYWPLSSIDSFSVWSTSYLGYSKASTMFGTQIFSSIPYLLSMMGLSAESISYLHNYGLIYTCSLVYYFIAKKISGNVLLAYFIGLFIILNNFVLEHLLVFPGVIFYSLIVYGITLYICYEIYLHGLNLKRIISIVLLSFFHLHPFYFFINLLFLFIFSLFYSATHWRVYSKKYLLGCLFILLSGVVAIQSYWLAPFIKNIFLSSSSQVYGGGGTQSAIFSGYFQSITYVNLFSLYHYPGTLGVKMHGSALQSFFYFYLLCLVIFLYIKDEFKNKKWIAFLFLNLFLFFNLALGAKSQLTGTGWIYLYENFPAFGFFRSFSRFIILYFVLFIFLFIFLFKDWKSRYKNYVLSVVIFLLLAANTIFFSGDFGGFITSAKVPKEYVAVNEKYFQGDESQYNILTLPNVPYESYSWFLTDQRGTTGERISQSLYFRENFFSKPAAYNRYAINLDARSNFLKSFFTYNEGLLSSSNFDQVVDTLNVRYVLIQKDLINILKDNAPVSVEKYLDYLNQDDAFVLKEDNASFALYENKDYLPVASMRDMRFMKVNDAKYILSIKNLKNTESLSFLQSYNEQWKLYLETDSNDKDCDSVKYYENTQTTECKPAEGRVNRGDLSYLYRKTIFNDTHTIYNQYANGWEIDSDYIKKNFPKDAYTVNPDGSIDLELTLYFNPQSYFYLGLIVSGIALVGCLGYLGYIGIIKRRKTE